jgi:basic membrane lipoprotein Med (substrate-binding protein (PBP1-ABC) superfamily)
MTSGGIVKRRPLVALIGLLAAFSLIAAACGEDDDASDSGAPAPAASEPAESTDDGQDDPVLNPLDANGDGEVILGIAAAGPRDDGAYYQTLINDMQIIADREGWGEIIIIDEIKPAVAQTEIQNLIAQNVDIIAVGSGEIADPLADLSAANPDLFWFCACGTGYPQTPGVALAADDGSEINYVAGVATALVLQETGGDTVAMIGCCGVNFELESELAFRMGLQSVDPSFDVTYTPTGNFPFDFDNVAGATEAFNIAVDAGADAFYPYLGGAHEAVVQLANEAGLPVLSAGASDVCDRPGDLSWDVAVKFAPGDYARAAFNEIIAGDLDEGTIRLFSVGVDEEAGAAICGATAGQQEILDQAHADVATGMFAEAFGAIKGQAYGGG